MKYILACFMAAGLMASIASARSVLANFHMANAETYTPETWKSDIDAAISMGIQGFGKLTFSLAFPREN
ncbi:uncharacterized protein K452DRAFT_301019 [Aplosporella prunicola CBS 121167]|uniref:Glycoside hydrolase family 5 protein n=1 Tax=Aplosporella prunicola CBS 121167 TaxID=1176127 RepID=A0A6A6B2P4_9PEZI|nr:uncharacterized protein K452DRAFT_301019 [Aplosporella prunicola CBS 121167]KAF2138482.1 hypothetical protein K452DRAFT_301019 [Aplosporella prunicola CBS 121167]